ncbi:hypothetical protein IG631_04215 [Alternaria alternata]|nr:hypothetical protein IG631_04215 [Alternaria alternata]
MTSNNAYRAYASEKRMRVWSRQSCRYASVIGMVVMQGQTLSLVEYANRRTKLEEMTRLADAGLRNIRLDNWDIGG